ncbi:MAG: NADPH:quinone oxidoreductase family protein [Acidimicrobiales bacterium]
MRVLEVQALTGPDGVAVAERPEPVTRPDRVVIDVVTAGVAFPDLLQSRGLYQIRPEPPFVAGFEAAGRVRSAPTGSGLTPGDRVCAWTRAALAEVVVCDPADVFALPDELSWEEGAALTLNYQTAVFCLLHRGGFRAGETLLVLGASGGVGTAAIQVARGTGAGRIIGLVSTPEKAAVAADAGADDVVVVSDHWKDDVLDLTGGAGVDVVYDPVGGDRFLDGIRSLARFGRLVVVGFAAGTIPEIKVNRLLLRNVSVVGAAWGEAVAEDRALARRLHAELVPLVADGAVRPPIGAVLPLEEGPEAYRLLDERRAVAKIVLRVAADGGAR